jgi:hypothetical protein
MEARPTESEESELAAPVIDTATLAPPVVEPAPTADAMTTARLRGKYKFLIIKARKIRENGSTEDAELVQAIRECKAQAGALNVRLELAEDDPTGNMSPTEELLKHAVAERDRAVEEQNLKALGKQAAKSIKAINKVKPRPKPSSPSSAKKVFARSPHSPPKKKRR